VVILHFHPTHQPQRCLTHSEWDELPKEASGKTWSLTRTSQTRKRLPKTALFCNAPCFTMPFPVSSGWPPILHLLLLRGIALDTTRVMPNGSRASGLCDTSGLALPEAETALQSGRALCIVNQDVPPPDSSIVCFPGIELSSSALSVSLSFVSSSHSLRPGRLHIHFYGESDSLVATII
jgi:hypothetical protein